MEAQPAERQVEEIESLCMNCHTDGTTRLLLTRIPFFREVVLMSFSCPECGFKNSEIQSAGEIQQRGIRVTFRLNDVNDLQRQVVKSDTCVFRIEDLDVEIPAGRGQLTNIEGLLSMVKQDLEGDQPQRMEVAEEMFKQIDGVIQKISALLNGEKFPFTVTINDPAGNSSVEPSPSDTGHKYVRSEYLRTPEQNAELGLGDTSTGEQDETTSTQAPATNIRPEYHVDLPTGAGNLNADALDTDEIVEDQVYSFPSSCPGCMKPCATNMKMVKIPHFEEVVLMSTVCEYCGYRSNEVKSGGAVPDKGRRITLKVLNSIDMSRDILKAESCALTCPELNLDVEPGTMGGRFTTVEGMLTQVRDDLRSSIFDTDDDDGVGGDSMASTERRKWAGFFSKLDIAIKGEMEFTLIMADPLAGSYVQSLTAPEPDPQLTSEEYERTEQEEEDLGLRDIHTEDYAEEDEESTEHGGDEDEHGVLAANESQEEGNDVQTKLANLALKDVTSDLKNV